MGIIQDILSAAEVPEKTFEQLAGALDRNSLAEHLHDLVTWAVGVTKRVEAAEQAIAAQLAPAAEEAAPAPVVPVAPVREPATPAAGAAESTSPAS